MSVKALVRIDGQEQQFIGGSDPKLSKNLLSIGVEINDYLTKKLVESGLIADINEKSDENEEEGEDDGTEKPQKKTDKAPKKKTKKQKL